MALRLVPLFRTEQPKQFKRKAELHEGKKSQRLFYIPMSQEQKKKLYL